MSTPSKFPPVLVGTIDADAIFSALQGENYGTTLPPTYGYVMNGGKPIAHLSIINMDDSQATDEIALELKRSLVEVVREVLRPYFERHARERGERYRALNNLSPLSGEHVAGGADVQGSGGPQSSPG